MTRKPLRDLHSMMYSSIAAPDLSQSDLEQLVSNARRSNALNDITGLLVFQDGCFLQVLEGDRKTLSQLFERKLLHDRRHRSVTLFHDEPLAMRRFRFWHLAFSNLDKQADRISSPFRESLNSERGLYELNSNTARALDLVRQIHRRVLCAQKPESPGPENNGLSKN